MWPFKNNIENLSDRTEKAAEILIEGTKACMQPFCEDLFGEENIPSNKKYIEPATIELLIFGIHLTDRIAFSKLGPEKRTDFMNILLPAIHKYLSSPMSSNLERLYNSRNMFYGGFRKLYPDNDEKPKGTLFWEFGKLLGSTYAKGNLVAMMQLTKFSMAFYTGTSKSLEKYKIFS